MITKPFIKHLKSQIEQADSERSKIIRETGSLVREAKHAIFSLQRGDFAAIAKNLAHTERALAALVKSAVKTGLRNEATLSAAIEEYLEARYLLHVLERKPLPQKFAFAPEADEQLAALADLTGELVRAATLEVTRGNYGSIREYRDATEELFGVLLSMNLRGTLRSKRDDARRNLRRLEEILYDVSLKA